MDNQVMEEIDGNNLHRDSEKNSINHRYVFKRIELTD